MRNIVKTTLLAAIVTSTAVSFAAAAPRHYRHEHVVHAQATPYGSRYRAYYPTDVYSAVPAERGESPFLGVWDQRIEDSDY